MRHFMIFYRFTNHRGDRIYGRVSGTCKSLTPQVFTGWQEKIAAANGVPSVAITGTQEMDGDGK